MSSSVFSLIGAHALSRSVLEARIVECGYPEGFRLRDISFKLGEGEVLVITGPSGSGKTTLIRALLGTIEVYGGFIRGEILLEGRELESWRPEDLLTTIAYIPQEPWYAMLGHTVYAEICHALSLVGVNCVETDFQPLGVANVVDRLTYTLSSGETQRVLWLESMLMGARIHVLDEPLIYLDHEARRIVKHYVKVASSRGASFIIVDHDPWEWEHLEPDLLVLGGGRAVYYGRWRADVLPPQVEMSLQRGEPRGFYARFVDVWFKYPGGGFVVKKFNANVEKGVLTVVTGPNGSGKTTILKLGAGLLKPSRGRVEVAGLPVYIPENPLLYFTRPTPREELLAAARGDENRALEVAEIFGLKHVIDRPLAKISSGERRRLAIASAYLAGFNGYFVDEPTGGLDNESARAVIEALQSLVNEGKAVFAASHDHRLVRVADKVIDLRERGEVEDEAG
jgi:energy-coupling factor transport system ATP-binding protein